MSIFDDKKKDGFKGERMIVIPTEAFKDYTEHPQIRRLYLTDVGYFPQAEHHYRERKDGIEEYIFMYCMEGSGIIEIEGKEYSLKDNEAFCIPRLKGHKYYACPDRPWSILWVHFKGEDITYYPLEECITIKFGSNHAGNRMLFLFELLFRVLEGNYTLGNFIYISQVLSLILAEAYNREKQHTALDQNRHVTDVIKYMYQHMNEELSLEQIVEAFNLSKSYLNAVFKKHTSHSPMDFYIQLKMKEACKLLRATDSYIYEVALKLGYKDQYYFSRIFKKVVGISPKEYKNSEYFHFEKDGRLNGNRR
ncbi:AraC family transcriptional regulator [Anaerocolumna sp. AGMB13020]|uniref:helix-turn-helix transcriptional regulator n=1 Tax=Anaerocolumna sp. AGMB13020 TaxID=3081750 RepID=UPI002954B690|nr:AraC family transcriptional regulator [Anaerocolumna sp. AGMB13020]WOO36688.1 AraC family transcriptional regulator [Anaerocolumna sp. AGMB13020]